MKRFSGLLERTLSALIMAISVALLTAGLFAYAPTPVTGDGDSVPGATDVAGNPVLGTDDSPDATRSPALSPEATVSPDATASPDTSASPAATASPVGSEPTPSAPAPTVAASPSPTSAGAVATRIAIPSLRIDLPIMSGDAEVPGNRDSYPLCDVAQYLVYYMNPGEIGTSYIYAHAQRGMFLPLLRASQRNDGAEMIGALVEVYTADNKLHLYEIFRVKRHARDLSLANNVAPGQHMLVLQTSEGTRGHIPKLQVAARPIGIVPATPAEANPSPDPRPCWR